MAQVILGEPTAGSRSKEEAAAKAGTELDFAELASCTAEFSDASKSDVDITANGFIRVQYHDAQLLDAGWMDIVADGEVVAYPALVIYVLEVSSAKADAVPKPYTLADNVVVPLALTNDPKPSVVFCGDIAGTLQNPPRNGGMRRIRVQLS